NTTSNTTSSIYEMNIATFNNDLNALFFNMLQMNQARYDIFYNPTPLNVNLQQVDDMGNINNVYVPNWALINQNYQQLFENLSNNITSNIYVYSGSSGTTFLVNHNLNQNYVFVMCYDQNGNSITPQNIKINNPNQIVVSFSNPVTPTILVSSGIYIQNGVSTFYSNSSGSSSEISLPTATPVIYGVVKYDDQTIVVNSNGQLTIGNVNVSSLPLATLTTPGIVQPDNQSITLNSNNQLSIKQVSITSLPLATVNSPGIVQPDDVTLVVNNGVMKLNMIPTNSNGIMYYGGNSITPLTLSSNFQIQSDTLDISLINDAGTYTKVTVDNYGRVISGSNLQSTDLPIATPTQYGAVTYDNNTIVENQNGQLEVGTLPKYTIPVYVRDYIQANSTYISLINYLSPDSISMNSSKFISYLSNPTNSTLSINVNNSSIGSLIFNSTSNYGIFLVDDFMLNRGDILNVTYSGSNLSSSIYITLAGKV
ncbi:MAG: hypothetical protein QW478_13955, partial [Candidatus Micrarchaeaceae archaeon]